MRGNGRSSAQWATTHGFCLEALDEDPVEERDKGLDRLERRLGSLYRFIFRDSFGG